MILANQGEATLRDENPINMAVWLYLKLVPLNYICWYAADKSP